MRNRPRVGSLFSGIGGIDLGLERAGFEVVWFCERDEYCQTVLAKHWPGLPIYDDATKLPDDLPPVDVITAGFPCQPVSYAGRRKAQDDDRWLWPYVENIIRTLRPRGVLLENVPGLFTAGFDDVIGGLAACGYDAEWDCIPAAAVGAPHRRDRVFIIATPCDVATDSARGGWDDPMAYAYGAGPYRPIRPVVEGSARIIGHADAAGSCSSRGHTPVSDAISARPSGHRGPKQTKARGHLAARGASDGPPDAMANSAQLQRNGGDDHSRISARPETKSEFGNSGGPDTMADSGRVGQQGPRKLVNSGSPQAHGEGKADWAIDDSFGKVWAPEPGVGRVADGIPRRVDRLRALGNAVVPQVAEYVGHQLARMMGVRNA